MTFAKTNEFNKKKWNKKELFTAFNKGKPPEPLRKKFFFLS